MVGQLAGGVAHDFNNLLHVILTYASLLEESAIDAAQRDDAHQISHAAASAADLTRQLLTFSRRDLIKPKVVDIPHAIYAMEKLLRRTVGPEIDLTIAIGQHVPHVLIDRSQLEQIILNLVVNARDATPTRGVISISIEGLDLDPVTAARRGITAGHYAQIEIADTGTGIPSELIGRIFEPYFNIKETGKGGLGLATVHGVIQQAAGDIVVASEVGRGTTFRILLPATDQRGEQPAWKGGTSSSHATILLVDDDDNVRRATERILRSAGYSVLSANSGHNAIAFAREHAGGIDLLLTDMTMPGMSGRELAGQVRSIGTIERVLFMSGYHSEGALSEAELIIKPFQRVDLLEKVRAVLAECFSPAQLASTMR
jgi:hypothetical protein